MDSLTQIVLGAAVGEAVLGKKIGNKALLYGAIAGTIPDLDIFASYFTDTVTALKLHRGFTHSILFSLMFAPVFGWIVARFEIYKNFKGWSWLFFWGFITHSILDAHTTWGTQLFYPFTERLAFKTIFVVDPLYTVPFMICLILVMFQKQESKRHFYNRIGLILSTSYLVATFFLKWIAYTNFAQSLKSQHIEYKEIDTRPSPLNTILWSANVETKDAYLLGNYSFFDTQPVKFESYKKNHELLGDLISNKKVKQMISISEGWYTIIKKDKHLYYNDLRFGTMDMKPGSQNFVFQYKIIINVDGNVQFLEQKKNNIDGKEMMINVWNRLKGN